MTGLMILFVAFIGATFILRQTTSLRLRRVQMGMARLFLAKHQAALVAFVEDARSPVDLRLLLLDWSEALEDGDTIMRVSETIMSGIRPARADHKLQDALNSLKHEHPDVADLFMKAVAAGIVAALLACDKTAANFDKVVAVMATDPARVQAVTDVVRTGLHRNHVRGGYQTASA